MPNDAHEARKWSCVTKLWLSLCVYNLDTAPGLINKMLSLLWIFDLVHTSSLVCILFVALCPYVSMGVVASLGQLLAINNDWTDWVLIIIAGNIRQSLLFDNQWEWGFNLDCIPLCTRVQTLEWGWHLPFSCSYWLSDKIQFLYWIFMSMTLFMMTVFDYYLW